MYNRYQKGDIYIMTCGEFKRIMRNNNYNGIYNIETEYDFYKHVDINDIAFVNKEIKAIKSYDNSLTVVI